MSVMSHKHEAENVFNAAEFIYETIEIIMINEPSENGLFIGAFYILAFKFIILFLNLKSLAI